MSSVYSFFFEVIGKGIEPHPTNEYHLSILSNDIETHGASTISGPAMPVRIKWFAIPFSTLYLYYTIAGAKSQGFTRFICAFCSFPHHSLRSARSIERSTLRSSFLFFLSASLLFSRLAIQGLVKYRLRLRSAKRSSIISMLFIFIIALLRSCPGRNLIVIIVCSFGLINQPRHAYYTTCFGVCQALSGDGLGVVVLSGAKRQRSGEKFCIHRSGWYDSCSAGVAVMV